MSYEDIDIRTRWYFVEAGFGVSVDEYENGEFCIMRGVGEKAGESIDQLSLDDLRAINLLIDRALRSKAKKGAADVEAS